MAWLKFIKHRTDVFLRNHPELLVTRSDKGKHTVLISKDNYDQKILSLVSSPDYQQLPNFDITTLITKNNQFVEKLFKLGIVSNRLPLLDSSVDFSKFYGLIKIHKPDKPARPIVSACSSPGFKLSKWLTDVLTESYCEKGYHVKNALEVVGALDGLAVSADEEMVSFDVISMFTSISIDLIVRAILDLDSPIVNGCVLDHSLLSDLLRFLLTECAVFQWNDSIYRQLDSLAMGSPLSPILARIIMTRIMNITIPRLMVRPKMLCIYVDDSFCIINKASSDAMLNELNKFHENIKFTIEKETNNELTFLNIKISHCESVIYTNWYKKPFASNRLLNFFSTHNRSTIINTAISFIKNILLLSDGKFFLENKVIIQQILEDNCFPTSLIVSLLHSHYTLMKPLSFVDRTGLRNPVHTSIKYLPDFSYPLLKRIKPFFPPNVSITCAPENASSNIFSKVKNPGNVGSFSNSIIILECECKKRIILRHTSFAGRVSDVFKDTEKFYENKKIKCTDSQHYFVKRSVKSGGRSHAETMVTYRSFNYLYRNKLIYTKPEYPNNYIVKALKKVSKKTNKYLT